MGDEPLLTGDERAAITGGRWFAALDATLRHDILRVLKVRRFAAGEPIFTQGEPATQWMACAAGAVRIASTTPGGRVLTLTFVRPGRWFGDPPLGERDVRSHDAWAQAPTTTVAVARGDLLRILECHPGFAPALVQLQGLRLQQTFGLVEELAGLGLRARLARQLLRLMRGYGEACRGGEVRIALRVRQDLLAQLLGCSRQRVNEQLRDLAADQVIRRERGCLVVRNPVRLAGFAATR